MKAYAVFTEHNDWEGETWNFYLEITQNGQAKELEKLEKLIKKDEEEIYEVGKTLISEQEVDILVKNAREGYMMSDTKLDEWKCPDKLEDLYKGGIINV